MSTQSLSDKHILLTGATSGIGKAIALACHEVGIRLTLLGRNEERLRAVAEHCGDVGGYRVCDLSEIDSLPGIVKDVVAERGPLDGLVHSAGLHKPAPLRAIREKSLGEMMSVNAFAAVSLLKGVARRGHHNKPCSAVWISSVMGQVGEAGLTGYAMSKGALEQAAKSLAVELAGERIRVNCIAPAMINTPLTEQFLAKLDEGQRTRILEKHPSGFGEPEDVAGTVLFLLSDASRFITGTSLPIDGGYCAQ